MPGSSVLETMPSYPWASCLAPCPQDHIQYAKTGCDSGPSEVSPRELRAGNTAIHLPIEDPGDALPRVQHSPGDHMALRDGEDSKEQREAPHSGQQATTTLARAHPCSLYRVGLLLAGCPDFSGTPNFRLLHKHCKIAPRLPKTHKDKSCKLYHSKDFKVEGYTGLQAGKSQHRPLYTKFPSRQAF